jgi:hypothetical protein
LFDKKYCKYDNFFNDVLEPLFVAFSTDLPENYYSKLDTKIPFLNGGLFDPIKNYNWLDTKITISNGLIYEILDNFEMYNFTIQEEDPEEKEVAIDPEMLGKVFENLLDIKDKKSKGTFYTPRKIAKYICEEALINYLINEVGDNDKATINQLVKNIYNFKQNNFIKKNYQLIDEKIKNIKICDPAIGSGEFPVELMNLCVSIRLSLNNFYNDKKRTSYLLKRNFIRNSIYGVDIEDSAIETAKLRLWLSLILDEEDYDKILPLPNLDYKIFKGDSLLSLESNLLGFEKKDEIALLKNEYFQTTNIKKKLELKKKIDFQFNSIMDGQVSFDFKIFFQEVFDQKQGFDLIVGNPPYVQIQKIKDRLYKSNLKNEYKVFTGNADLYCLFFEKGRELLNDKGCLAYITSNKWLKSAYGSLLRNFFLDKCNIIQLIDFKSLQIFKKASVDTSIVLLKKGSSKTIKACEISDFDKYQNFEMTLKNENITLKRENLLSSWAISHGDENLLLTKIKNIKNKLDLPRNKFRRGITTGLNSVFLINEKVRKQLINEDKKNQFLIKKIVRGKNMYKYTYDKGLDYLLYIPWHFPLDVEGINGASDEAELAFKKEYKSLYKYLSNFKEDLKRRNEQETGIRYEWYVLQRPGTSFVSDFNQTKVGWMNMNRGWKFSLIDKDIFLEASCNFVADNEYAKYLVGIYSSNVHKWYFKKVGRMFDDGGYMCKVDTISEFPVVKPSSNEKIKIEKMVDLLINSPNEQNERNLNNYIYELYGLNNKEKAIVDTIK